MKNKDLKISLLFAMVGLMAGASTAMYQYQIYDQATKEAIISQLGSIEVLLSVSAMQTGIMAFVASFIGLKLARKSNLSLNFKYSKDSFLSAVVIAFLVALIISVSEKFIFAQYMPENLTGTYKFNLIYLLTGVLYGGIIEELMLRLLIMSLAVVILMKLFKVYDESIRPWMYAAAIIISSLLFAAGHLPFASQMFGLSVPIVVRVLVLNSVGGLGYGYLYWKKGLAYSILAHMLTHVFNQLLLLPLLF